MRAIISIFKEHDILLEHRIAVSDADAPLPRPVTDNREISTGDAFIAIKGENFDGHSFLDQARKSGAGICIGEYNGVDIRVKDSRKAAALYAKIFYDDPGSKLKLYGITGTNGKTTCSLMIYQMLINQGLNAAWIGTLGYKILRRDYPTKHTTPDILQLNEILVQMIEAGVSHVVMEVSSHALALHRVYGIDFDFNVFTNLSRDHLDFHRSMDDYFEVKYSLFERAADSAMKCFVNTDDAHGRIIYDRLLAKGSHPIAIGHHIPADLKIQSPNTSLDGARFDLVISDSDQTISIESPLIGDFNIDNLALALAVILHGGTTTQQLPLLCASLKAPPGRIQPVKNDLGIGIYVDYAHSPDAISNVLKSLAKLARRRVITVFGAGGDRDKGKRPLMLQAALRNSDVVIITDDNPRFESPESIVYDIVKDTEIHLPWWIIRDRKEAIKAAIRLAREEDIVVICGKGHENYQEIRGNRHFFDDVLEAESAIKAWNSPKADDEPILPLDPLILRLLNQEGPNIEGNQDPQCYRYISTDSRTIKSGSAFFAISGENFDGNRYIKGVLADPNNIAIGRPDQPRHERLIRAEDPTRLMALTLGKYLQIFDLCKIALTGSTGKTSTKEILAHLLSCKAPTIKTQRNENNIIGLCKTILRVEPKDRYAVFEIGTNHFGEIAHLADTISPDAGMILNIGPSHLEYFGDEDGVFREKTELFHRALGYRIFPADDPRFESYRKRGKSVGFSETADYKIDNLISKPDSQEFQLNDHHFRIPHPALHYVINSAFCLALCMEFGLSPQDLNDCLQKKLEIDMRMQIQVSGNKTLIVDCYNANPVSMQAAIEFWKDYEKERPHVAFLGDMLELGESAEMYHTMIGTILLESGEHTLYTVGKLCKLYQNQDSHHYDSVDELLHKFPGVPDDSVILVKASHGIELDKILPILRGEI